MVDKYSLSKIYSSARFNGYGEQSAFSRFEVLKKISFNSVLDVGSGPCLLQKWLKQNNIVAQYEAMDIRANTLQYCDCPTYTTIPVDKSYDLICLFGTITYNIDHDEHKNKLVLKTLLKDCKNICNSILLFTVFKEEIREKNKNKSSKDFFVYFSEDEIKNILFDLKIYNFNIIENDEYDIQEYFVICYL